MPLVRSRSSTATAPQCPVEGRLNASFVEWLMGLPTDNAAGLSRTARIRLAGNAVVGLQARPMLQRGLTAINNTKGII